MQVQIKADLTGAFQKTATLKGIHAAFRKNAQEWAADTVKYIKDSTRGGGGNFGPGFRNAPKEIEQRLAYKFASTGAESGIVTIGTGGYVGLKEVIYARIQELGGTIVPKTKKFLVFPRPGSGAKGSPLNYAKGDPMRKEFIFAKKVTLPARHWFSAPIAQRMPELNRTMTAEAIWARAERMGNVAVTGKSWGGGG